MSVRPKGIMKDRERGVATAEFIAVLPMLLLIFFLIVEFGWVLKNYLVVTNAGREVARCAAVDRCLLDGATATPLQMAVSRIRDGGGIHPADVPGIEFSVHFEDSAVSPNGKPDAGESLIVCIDSPSRHITPLTIFAGWTGVLPDPVHLRARTEMRIERPMTGLPGSSALCS